METEIISNQSIYQQMLHENMNKGKDGLFKELVTKTQPDITTTRNSDLTYENIKGITQDEIDLLFTGEAKQMAENLKLSTQFTEDEKLSRALFNTVLGQPFNMGKAYLFDRYHDKSSFLSQHSSLADLLEKSIQNRTSFDSINKVSEEQLNDILTTVNSFNFVSTLTNTTKDLSNRYKDDDNYSFLYNDYFLQYEQLLQKYEDEKYKEMMFLKQF